MTIKTTATFYCKLLSWKILILTLKIPGKVLENAYEKCGNPVKPSEGFLSANIILLVGLYWSGI